MNEMIKAERNKICSRKQTRMLFLAGVVLIVAYFFFFQFNYQNVFYDYDLEKMALASGFTAIEQRKEVAEIFEGKLSQNTLLTMQEKIDQAKQATVGQDENSAFSAVHVYRDQAAILEYLTNSDGSFKSLETAYPNSPTVTLGYCDGWDKLLSGMGSILSIMICLIVVITLSPVFSEEYALHTISFSTISSAQARMLFIIPTHLIVSVAFSSSVTPCLRAISFIRYSAISRAEVSISARCSYNLPLVIRLKYNTRLCSLKYRCRNRPYFERGGLSSTVRQG